MKFLNLLFVLAFVFSLASCNSTEKAPAGEGNTDSSATKTETTTVTEPSATTTTEPSETTTTEPSATTVTAPAKK